MKNPLRVVGLWVLGVWVLCGTGLPAWAFTKAELDSRIWEARAVLEEFMKIPEERIPPELLKKARAVLIFPNTVKAGFMFAGQFGRGVFLSRDEASGKWSAPLFCRISGGSFGFQIGGQATDIILIVTNERGMLGLLQNKFTLGADASVAAGPLGRDAELATDWQLKAGVLSYSRSKGFFAGVSVDGMVVNQEKEANDLYYGTVTKPEDILLARKFQPSEEAKKLIQAIEEHSR